MISCSFFYDHHSQAELAAEGFFGASDLLSDLRCNGVHCWEQLWKRWKRSATHKGRGAGRTGFILADTYLWTQTDITFDRRNGPWFPTQTFFLSRTLFSPPILMSAAFFQPLPLHNARRKDHSNYWSVVTFTVCIVLGCNKDSRWL